MKGLKLLIPVLIILISGCKVLNKNKPEEYRTGQISLKEVKRYKWFKLEYRNYTFTKNIKDSLTSLNNYTVIIVGGEWCGDTKLQLPRFIKILETVKFPFENLKIIFVDRSKQKPKTVDNSYESYKIKFIPTFIICDKSGTEVGRIVETPSKTLEEDLLRIITTNSFK